MKNLAVAKRSSQFSHKQQAAIVTDRRKWLILIGRDDWIRTSDLTHPKRARYQAAPRPVNVFSMTRKSRLSNRD